jgi:glycosyltransferase involved in cell wall biosynthesis
VDGGGTDLSLARSYDFDLRHDQSVCVAAPIDWHGGAEPTNRVGDLSDRDRRVRDRVAVRTERSGARLFVGDGNLVSSAYPLVRQGYSDLLRRRFASNTKATTVSARRYRNTVGDANFLRSDPLSMDYDCRGGRIIRDGVRDYALVRDGTEGFLYESGSRIDQTFDSRVAPIGSSSVRRSPMNSKSLPLVSIITPLHNNEEDLAECIESVLAQTYENWDYVIVNNASTDQSPAIARRYAAKDPRIKVVSTDRFLDIIASHNYAAQQISATSKYCKFVYADDWLYPDCIEELVRVAERHPSVGLVGAYAMDGRIVLWPGPPYPSPCIPGREACRNLFRNQGDILGTLTSLLMRSDLARKRSPFLNEKNLHADLEICFDMLQESDFGFVHQVLCFVRPREQSNTTVAKNLESIALGHFIMMLKYGPVYLEEAEFRLRKRELSRSYHRVLAKNVLRLRPKSFWEYQKRTLAAFGGRIDYWLLMQSVISEIIKDLSEPAHTLNRCQRWWSRALK